MAIKRSWLDGPLRNWSAEASSLTPSKYATGGFVGSYVCERCLDSCDGVYRAIGEQGSVEHVKKRSDPRKRKPMPENCQDCLRLRAENLTLLELLRQKDQIIFHLEREIALEMEKRRPVGRAEKAS